MTTRQDFAELRELALDCVWSVQALVALCDRKWPPTRRCADTDAWQARNLERDYKAVAFRLGRAFDTCATTANHIFYELIPENLDPIRATVAGRPFTLGAEVYTTAHEAAYHTANDMADIHSQATRAAERDEDNHDFAFADTALSLLRDLPPTQAIEAGIEHEHQLVVTGMGVTDDANPLPRDPTKDYTTKEAAGKLGVTDSTVTRWCAATPPKRPCHNAYKFGGTWRIPQADITRNRA